MKIGKLYKGKAVINIPGGIIVAPYTCLLLEDLIYRNSLFQIKVLRTIINPETSEVISSKIELVDVSWLDYTCKEFNKDIEEWRNRKQI